MQLFKFVDWSICDSWFRFFDVTNRLSVRIFDFDLSFWTMDKSWQRLHLCLKFRYSQKFSKIWKFLPLCFDVFSYFQKEEDFFLILRASHDIWTLPQRFERSFEDIFFF